jgi:hypothetical protein
MTTSAPAKPATRTRNLSSQLAEKLSENTEGPARRLRSVPAKTPAAKPAAAKSTSAKPAGKAQDKPQPGTKPAPAKPAPTAEAETLPGTLSVLPVVGTLPDGTKVGRTYFYAQVIMKKAADTIKCGHEYLHENEASAKACARKMQREGKFTPRNG